ncbi:ferrochelatase [Parvularcula bermudensis HTCC2503]|uniref:Ferrochelatase n=2 Tax=Parvularcula TaxID=208215 RepID=E0TF49_PARBH|nr:ferrochelatase [Parvularcula bermudensis HTCC2503]
MLVNLGTPDAPEAKAVKRYLREFLSDKRVVDYPRLVWLPVLHGIILNVRPRKTAALYAKIWHRESGKSPLAYFTERQAEGVKARLSPALIVRHAMRYGSPSIDDRLREMTAEGCDRILIVPLYPQYSATTTATVMDKVSACMSEMAWQPALRSLPPFYDDPSYLDALEGSVRRALPEGAERIILSYHGIPERYFAQGDPYHCHCQKTSRLLRERMGWSPNFAPIGFQSKFGPEKWLDPSTESLVIRAAKDGIKRLAVIAPAFVSDCLETLEEVAIGLAETFEEHGGEVLTAIPCLNDDPQFLDSLAQMIERELGGWEPAATS